MTAPVVGAPVWVESYGVTLAGTVTGTEYATSDRFWSRVTLEGADPFGRYSGRVTVADGQLRPRRVRCDHDTGSMYGCEPLCDAPATHVVRYANGTYPCAARVCAAHVRVSEARAYPGHIATELLP